MTNPFAQVLRSAYRVGCCQPPWPGLLVGCCPYPPSSLLIFGVVACLHENRLLGFTLTLKGFKILIEYCFLLSKKGKIFFVRPPAARNYLRSLHTHSGGTPDPIVYIQYNTIHKSIPTTPEQ